MRTKLFLAFLLVIVLSLLSNIIFQQLIKRDFDEYLKGEVEDRLYLLMAAVEGTFQDGFDRLKLSEALHWGMMLGFESYVTDKSNQKILSSVEVYKGLSEPMKKRMKDLFRLPYGKGQFMWYPLYYKSREIGSLYVRPLVPLGLQAEKARIFKDRVRKFLIISTLIAGGGAVVLAVALMFFISRPIKRLLIATSKVREGDLTVRVPYPHNSLRRFFHLYDEIDKLTNHFNYMVEALRKEDEIRRQMASTLAHELRTPLTVIKGILEAYEDGLIESPERFVESLRKEIDRLLSLVEVMEDLKMAQESFFKKGSPEEVDLKEFIEQLLEPYRPIFSEKGLYLKLNGRAIKVDTYPEKLTIILKNLISNALQWTVKGGITISWGRQGKRYYIEVQDTGPGIDKEEADKIFNRFYKSKTSKGRGLGLFIAKQLALAIDGDIILETQPGKGSTFRLLWIG